MKDDEYFVDDSMKRVVALDHQKIFAKTVENGQRKLAERKKKPPLRAEVDARRAAEERDRRENLSGPADALHEISNKELKRYAEHRRVHRGEDFVRDGGVLAVNGKVVKQRRIIGEDARLKKALGNDRWIAMALVRAAYRMIASGMGMQTFNPFREPGGGGDIQAGLALMSIYWRWAVEVQRRRLSHAMCIAICVEGLTITEASKDYRCRWESVKENLLSCLDVAIEEGILKLRARED